MATADGLIALARERTGLDDFGSDTFHEGLVALVDGAHAGGTFNELGLAVVEDQALNILTTRLRIEDWYGRHPEIDEQEIVAPLFGLGLPRTGSTALSYLLAQDPRSRSLLTWETSCPVPPPEPETYETDPRIAEAAVQISFIDGFAPKFKTMLPSAPDGPNECLQLLQYDFRSSVFSAMGDNRAYDAWLAACDMRSAYEYHRRVLKLLQWKFEPRPWRLKSPAHMPFIESLVAVYPDARFVMTHRDIAQAIPSVVSLLDATGELLREGPLADDFGERQTAFWEHALRTTLAFREAGNDGRFYDIAFADMRPDPVAAVAGLYEFLGDELTDDVIDRMRAWWDGNPADKNGVHEYRPQDYGIDLDELRERFAFYNDRFAGTTEAGTNSMKTGE